MTQASRLARIHQLAQINNAAAAAALVERLGVDLLAGRLSPEKFRIYYLQIEQTGHVQACELAKQYMLKHREIFMPELLDKPLADLTYDPVAGLNRVDAGLTLIRKGQTLADSGQAYRAAAKALADLAVWGNRAIMNAGRRQIVASATKAGTGWRRICDADPCAFCAMLAGRGAIYYSKASAISVVGSGYYQRSRGNPDYRGKARGTRRIGERYHDRCGCTVQECPDNWQKIFGESPQEQLYASLYDEAAKQAKNGETKDVITAYEHLLTEQRGHPRDRHRSKLA